MLRLSHGITVPLLLVLAVPACRATPAAATEPVFAGLDLARLQPRTDHFTVLVQDKARGRQTCELARTDDGWLYTETTTIAPVVDQKTEVWLDASGRTLRVRQRGTMAGKPMQIDADYRDGRVLADAITPSAPAPVHSDQPLTPGTIDDNALQALLPAVRFDESTTRTVTVFASGKGRELTARLERIGSETVPTGQGNVAAARIRVTIGEATQEFVVAEASPHAILRMQAAGAPFVMQRAD